MCVESQWGLSANYRLKSDNEKLDGKGTAARSWAWQKGKEKEENGFWFLAKSSHPLQLKNKIQSSWCSSFCLIPFQHHPKVLLILWDKGSGVIPRWDHNKFHEMFHLLPDLMLFPIGAKPAARSGLYDLPKVNQPPSSHTYRRTMKPNRSYT